MARKRSISCMSRDPVKPEKKTYGGRVAARIRTLRSDRGWSVEDLCERLATAGVPVEPQTLRSYERGKGRGGSDLPMNLAPAFAEAFGFKRPGGWLPVE